MNSETAREPRPTLTISGRKLPEKGDRIAAYTRRSFVPGECYDLFDARAIFLGQARCVRLREMRGGWCMFEFLALGPVYKVVHPNGHKP